MINILHNRYDIQADWLKPALSRYIKPHMRVCVVAFSFRGERVKCSSDWDGLYAPGGVYHEGIVGSFLSYGIGSGQIEFINYFKDTKESAREKVKRADILYFPGGLPDRMMERIREFGLIDAIKSHQGIAMGYSAGSLIQLREYHLSPDRDYPKFGYYEGLGWLDEFLVEVHYEDTAVQNEAIARALRQRKRPVYGLPDNAAIIVSDDQFEIIGPAKLFLPE